MRIKMTNLRQAIYTAAGWCNCCCHLCGKDMIKVPGLGFTSTVCINLSCESHKSQKHYISMEDDND